MAALATVFMGQTLLPAQFHATSESPHQETRAPSFYKDVLPILQDHCQNCHRPGEVAPMPLMNYEQTRPWSDAIAHSVSMRMMPPWFADPRYGHFADDPSLSQQQIDTILAWVKAGSTAGDPHDAPPPRHWTEGWNIGPT